MMEFTLPRMPPEPLRGTCLKKHFTAIQSILWNQAQMVAEHSPVSIGNAREDFIHEFLSDHLPPSLRIGSGHILLPDGKESGQIDIVVYRHDGFALPLGRRAGLFSQEAVVAAIEVKSTLKKVDLTGQIAENFAALPESVLKVVVTCELANKSQHRGDVGRWAEGVRPEHRPDIVLILDNGAIVKGGVLKSLGNALGYTRTRADCLYKLGSYHTDKWFGWLCLAFELYQRQSPDGVPGLSAYMQQALPEKQTLIPILKDK